jgi:hypothetical protein
VRICAIKESAPRFLALTAMLLTLGLAGVDEGIVVCFGGDGHVAIEAVGPEGCAEIDEAADHAASAIAVPVSSSHCGPCVDVVFTPSSVTGGAKVSKRIPSAAAAISTAELRPPVPHLRASFSYPHFTRFISEKPHTVVIRC